MIKNYLSLIKFSHTIFAMPFAMIGFFLGVAKMDAQGRELPNRYLLFLMVVLCMVFARSAAMAFNRWLDQHFDAKNPRTAVREIPAGIISSRNAMIFVVLNCIAFIVCTYFINWICFLLSPVALFVILFYSYTKRFTPLCHLVLGLGLSLAPIGAYLAVTGVFDLLPLLFSFAVIFWVSGFDIIYSLQDEEFDRSQNLFSIPSWLGKAGALQVSRVFHVLSAGSVIFAGILGDFSYFYWAGALVFCAMLVYQHSLVKPLDLSRVNLAFMTTNGIASVVFAVFVLVDLLRF